MTTADHNTPLLVTAAIITRGDEILATRRPADKKQPLLWEFPGGKMEAGESPQQALQRELREELAIEIEVNGAFDIVYHCYDWGPVLILAYRCSWISGEIQHLEVSDHCWASAEELNQLPFLAADQPLIDHLLQDQTSNN